MQNWLAALSEPTEERVAEACAEDIVVYRYRIFAEREAVAETFTGRAEVLEFLQRSPEGIVWSLVSDDGSTARYHLAMPEHDFENGGTWRYTLREGLLAELHHHADAISQDPPA